MLFDLRARGRRRVVKVVYLFLAVLLGGGLVLFGIGGDVQGGLVDAITGNQTGDAAKQVEKRVEDAEATIRREPQNARAYAVLAESRYQLAGQSEGFDETTGAFTGDARRQIDLAARAWNRHLELAGDSPNLNAAGTMINAFQQVGRFDDAVRAQEIILDARGDQAAFGDYARLASLAYSAGQSRKGDLAAERATELAKDQSKETRDALKASLEQAKAQAATSGAGAAADPAAAGAAGAPSPSGE